MNIALCIGCLATLTALAEATGLPEQQVGLEGRSQGYNITRNELGTDDEDSMEARKGKGYCVPSPYCSKHGYCVKKRKHCDGTVKKSECCGSKKCFCCIPECVKPFHKIPGSGRCYLFSGEAGASSRNWGASRQFCKDLGGDLACAGYLPATDADPLLAYVQEKGLGSSHVGAYWSGSQWIWLDGRNLSVESNMWLPLEPSGGEDCVEILHESIRPYNTAYLNYVSCTSPRAFICEYK